MSRGADDAPRRVPAGPLNGRAAAAVAVETALTGRGFAMDLLRKLRRSGQLAPREAGLATQVALGALRHVRTIRHLLRAVARFDAHRTPPRVQAILYGAAYQMVWLDRVPLFAAASEAVTLARALASAAAARMVNALLRRLSAAIAERRTAWRPGDPRLIRVGWDAACAFNREVVPAGGSPTAPEALAVLTGETPERIRALQQRHGPAAAEDVAWASQAVPAIVVQRNRLRATAAVFHAAARDAGALPDDCAADTAFIAALAFHADAPLLRDGLAYVQDATAAAAAALVAARPGERVLDLCAAPGGKTLALAIAMEDRGELVACDVDPARLARVAENAERLGLGGVRTTLIDPADELPSLRGVFDGVLLDVPCSNTGVIARRPEARLDLGPQKLAALGRLQVELLRRAAACVRPDGRLVYSTCSIEPEENEQPVQAFLATAPGWRFGESHTTLPRWGPRPSDWRDGGFAALLCRA